MNYSLMTRTLMFRLAVILAVVGSAIATLPQAHSGSTASPITQPTSKQALALYLSGW